VGSSSLGMGGLQFSYRAIGTQLFNTLPNFHCRDKTSFTIACTIGPFIFNLCHTTHQIEHPTPLQPAIAPHSTTQLTLLRHMVSSKDPQFAEKLEATGELVDDIFLNRWLQVKKCNLEEATAALTTHVDWRVDFIATAYQAAARTDAPLNTITNNKPRVPNLKMMGPLPESSMTKELQAEKVFLQGSDRHGHPVVIIKASKHDMRTRDLGETNRLIAYTLDNAALAGDSSLDPNARLCCLLDLAGLTPKNCDYKALLAIFEMLQHQYPERLSTLYFVNAPFIFWGVWRIVSPFVPPGTRAKLRFVSGEVARVTLSERIGEDVLPLDMGGRAGYTPIDAAVAYYLDDNNSSTSKNKSSGGGGHHQHSNTKNNNNNNNNHHHHHHHGKVAAVKGAAGAAGRFINRRVIRPITTMRLPHNNNNNERQQWEARLRRRGGVVMNHNHTRVSLLERVLLPGLLLSIILNVIREAWLRARGLSEGGGGRGGRQEKLTESIDEDVVVVAVEGEEEDAKSECSSSSSSSSTDEDSQSETDTIETAIEEEEECRGGRVLLNRSNTTTTTTTMIAVEV